MAAIQPVSAVIADCLRHTALGDAADRQFQTDEVGPAFVVRRPGDASLAVTPQVPMSVYHALPRAAEQLFGVFRGRVSPAFDVSYGHRGVVYRASGDATEPSRCGLACRVHVFRHD